MNLYQKAERCRCVLEYTCTAIGQHKWDELMKGAKRADRLKVVKAALKAGIIDQDDYKRECSNPYYNPYKHFKTDTHLIYVHSAIEHFIAVEDYDNL